MDVEPGPGSGARADAQALEPLRVRSIGFAPIKGTRHRERPDTVFDDHGPVGDRAYCVVDVERRTVLKTVQNPRLLAVEAELRGSAVEGETRDEPGRDEPGLDGSGLDAPVLDLALPDGRCVNAPAEPTGETLACDYWKRTVDLELTDGPHAAFLSEWLGRTVRLARAPRGGVVYGAPISIVATASIAELGERVGHPDLLAEVARFRSTLLIDTDVPFVEETWEGRTMMLGDRRVRIGEGLPRCAVIDLDPRIGERNTRLLKTVAGYRPRNEAGEPIFGVYAHLVD